MVTGVGTVGGRTVCVMANDYTVKAGSWGEKTIQKIVRIQERAQRLQVPMIYLVDAAGGRISEQIKIFPGRFHAGRIFYNEVQLSGVVPQVCILFGPSPAGSAYLPALTDCVIMVDGKASLYVGSPRMVEMAIGEKTTLEELGGARMHCTVSGCGDVLAASDEEAIEICRRYLSYLPGSFSRAARPVEPAAEAGPRHRGDRALRPAQVVRHVRGDRPRDRRGLLLRDQAALRAGDHRGLRADRRTRRRHRGEPAQGQGRRADGRLLRQGGAVHRALQRLQCPAPVPGRRPGLHGRHQGGAGRDHPPWGEDGLRDLAGHRAQDLRGRPQVLRRGPLRDVRPAFEPDAALALPQGQIAIMGPEPAVNAVYYNKIMELPESERAAYVQEKRDEYAQDVDIYKLASEMLVDGIVGGFELRDELIKRLAYAESKQL